MAPPASNKKALNGYLSGRSYIDGYTPTSKDAEYFNAVGEVSEAEGKKGLPYLYRWWLHINSFSAEERAAWGGAVKVETKKKVVAAAPAEDDDDSDDDLFGDSDDDEEADRLAELRISAAAKKHAEERAKAGKKKKVDKTLMVIEMNPLDAETDLTELEAGLREKITPETLKGMIHWGVEAKREDIAFGLQKLVMSMAVLDDDCSQDDITEMIEGLFEDSVGRVSVPTMSKI